MTDDDMDDLDKLLNFTPELRDKMEAEMQESFGQEFQLFPEQWEQLRMVFVNFLRAREYWSGFLTKGQIDKIEALKKKVARLLEALEDIEKDELGWVLELENSRSPIYFKERLEELTRMELLSPRVPRKDDEGNIIPHLLTDQSYINLQAELDDWWLRATGTKPVSREDIDTPYFRFFNHVQSAFPLEIAPGGSHKSIKVRQAKVRRPSKQMIRVAKRLQELVQDKEKGN